MLNTNLVTHFEQKPRELPLEARHTLSLELSRKRRLSVASSIFIPKDNAQGEPRAKISPDSEKLGAHELTQKKSPPFLIDKTNLTNASPKKKLKRAPFMRSSTKYKGQFVLTNSAQSPLKHPESYPIRKQIISSDHIRYVAESLRDNKVQDVTTGSMELSERRKLDFAYEEQNDEEYKSAEEMTEDNLAEQRHEALRTPIEENPDDDEKSEKGMQMKNSNEEAKKATTHTDQNTQPSTLEKATPSSSSNRSPAHIKDFSSVTRTENYIITVDSSGAHVDIKIAAQATTEGEQSDVQTQETQQTYETQAVQETHSDREFYTPPLSITSLINEDDRMRPQFVQRNLNTEALVLPSDSIKLAENSSKAYDGLRNHFRPIPLNGFKANPEPLNHFGPPVAATNSIAANGNHSGAQTNLHNHFRPIHNAPVTKTRQSRQRLPTEPPTNANPQWELIQAPTQLANSKAHNQRVNKNRMKIESDPSKNGNVIDLTKDTPLAAPQPINLSQIHAYPTDLSRNFSRETIPSLLTPSAPFPPYDSQLGATQRIYAPQATTATTPGMPSIPASSAFCFNDHASHNIALSPSSRRYQPPLTSSNQFWPPAPLRRPYSLLDMASVWQQQSNNISNGGSGNNVDLNMNALTNAMSRLPLVTPYGSVDAHPASEQLELQQRYASLAYNRPTVPSAIWSYPLPTTYTPLSLTPICLPNESMSRLMTEQYQRLRANWTSQAQTSAAHGSTRRCSRPPMRQAPAATTLESASPQASPQQQPPPISDIAYASMRGTTHVGFQPYISQRNGVASSHQFASDIWSPPQTLQLPQSQPQHHHRHQHQHLQPPTHQHFNFNGYTYPPNAANRPSYSDARPYL